MLKPILPYHGVDDLLLSASSIGNLQMMRDMRGRGANVSFDNDVCIVTAAMNGQHEAIALLAEWGADPNARGGTPLEQAAKRGFTLAVKALLKAKADPNIGTGHALIFAVGNDKLETARDLLGAGINVHTNYSLAIINAVKYCHEEMAALLFEHGADPFAGHGALMLLAIENEEHGIAEDIAAMQKIWREDFRTRMKTATDLSAFIKAPATDICGKALFGTNLGRAIEMGLLNEMVAEMQTHKVPFTEDMLFSHGKQGQNALTIANEYPFIETDAIKTLFAPENWRGDIAALGVAWKRYWDSRSIRHGEVVRYGASEMAAAVSAYRQSRLPSETAVRRGPAGLGF